MLKIIIIGISATEFTFFSCKHSLSGKFC
jgi:hypothetical protein